MNTLVTCPGCGFVGGLPPEAAGLQTVSCPNCQTKIPVEAFRRPPHPVADEVLPICVDGAPPRPLAGATNPGPAEPDPYTGNFMKDEAERFARYVAARLADLHKRRHELADAECRFESGTMAQKQELTRARAALAADADTLKRHEAEIQSKEAALAARETELAKRESEVAAREARVARAEARAAETDRRLAELRATIDQLDARRAALTEERAELDRRAEALDRAELALHRRTAELDELDERLRLEQEEFERERAMLSGALVRPD